MQQQADGEPAAEEVSKPTRSVLTVLVATAVSAVSSFVVLLIVAPALGPSGYAVFAVYWAALFMVVGVLFGVQQETTRAVAQIAAEEGPEPASTSPMRFAVVLGLGLLLVIGVTGWWWSIPLFGEGHQSWAIPLAIAVAAYVGVAALNGILAGRGAWGPFAAIPLIDGLLRLLLVALALWLDLGGTALAWAVAIPFPVSLIIVLCWKRRFVATHAAISGGYQRLAVNSSRTVLASAANALLVNGFPVVLSLFAGANQDALGAVVLALTLTRAPILVPLTALQSMLIARFSGDRAAVGRFMIVAIGGIAVVAGLIALVAGLWGESVLGWVFGEGFAIAGWLLAGLVLASGCLGVLTVTGAAALARERHNAFAAGWVVAALVAIVLVAVLPSEVGVRTIVALVSGPLIGAVWHLLALRVGHDRSMSVKEMDDYVD